MSPTFTSDDVGKPVETAEGEQIGVVADVDPETAYVEPAPDAGDSTRAALDWGGDEEAVPLADSAVGEWADDAIRLEADFAADAITSGAGDEGPDDGESSAEGAAEIDRRDAAHEPGEPVASNPTEAAPNEPGTTPDEEIDAGERAEPMVEDDEFYDTPEGEARVDPDDRMEPPEETAETEPSETGDRIEGTTTEESDRDDVDVDVDEVTDGDPEAEIDPEEDVGQREGPGDSSD